MLFRNGYARSYPATVGVIYMATSPGEVTSLLHALRNGDRAAEEKLIPLVYSELHRLARSYMRRERPNHTLQPTALINEAYMGLANAPIDWQNRAHFIGVAANAMCRILVDHARAHMAAARGGELRSASMQKESLRFYELAATVGLRYAPSAAGRLSFQRDIL